MCLQHHVNIAECTLKSIAQHARAANPSDTDWTLALQMGYRVSEPAQLAHLCSLTSLQEARLHFETDFDLRLNDWVPPQPGLCSLKRLALNR